MFADRWQIQTHRPLRTRLFFALVLAVGLGLLAVETLAAAPPKRARPPKFPESLSDVFAPDAREKLVGPRPNKSSPNQSSPSEAASTPATSALPKTPVLPGAKVAWSKWISADAVEDEIKAQQIKLSEAVASSAKFKAGQYQQARLHLSLLAALLAIDAEFDEKMRWQKEAAQLRDLVGRAGWHAKKGDDDTYKEAKARSDDVESLVRGGSIDAGGASGKAEWPKIAERAPLMKRLEQAHQQGLAPWTANEKDFAQHTSELDHEAQLIAALGEAICREGYEFADDATYQEYARDMQTQAVALREATAAGNYAQARAAVGEISKACAACHDGFRN